MKVVVLVNHFKAFSYSVGPVTVKYSSLRVNKIFSQLKKMLLNRKSKPQ